MKFAILFCDTDSRALVKNRPNLTIVDTRDNNDGPRVSLVYTKRQRQHCDDTSDTVLIENNRVAQESNLELLYIVFNENSIASDIPKLMQR